MKSEFVNDWAISESKMYPQVILRKIASAAPDFINLAPYASPNFDARPDTVLIGLGPNRFDCDPVVVHFGIVAQEEGGAVHVVNRDVDVSIVVVVAESDSSRGGLRLDSRP